MTNAKNKLRRKPAKSLKQRIVSIVVIVVPALIVIAWLAMTIYYHEPSASR